MLLSGAFLLALVLLGIVVAADRRRPAALATSEQRRSAAVRPAPPRRRATRRAAGCDLPAGSQAMPSSSPPQARWGTVGSMQVPQNPAVYGPQRTERRRGTTCFAHDPVGRAAGRDEPLGGVNTAVPASELLRRLRGRRAGEPRATTPGSTASGPVQFAGYRYDSYTPRGRR